MTISAKVIQSSYNPVHNATIITFELEYNRFIHSELLTHRVFSRNAASSRAIPVPKMLELIKENPAMPIHWGKNKPGMQASEEVHNVEDMKLLWKDAAKAACTFSSMMHTFGLHKQVTNRITEPFQHMKTVLTTTCMKNFESLRAHPDAMPEIKELAERMFQAAKGTIPTVLNNSEWHVPYVQRERVDGEMCYFNEEGYAIDPDEALVISTSCCAQVSYRKTDSSPEKAEDIYNKLIDSKPAHASPTEHQATPITTKIDDWLDATFYFDTDGVTHVDKNLVPWSGNFHGWVQHRQLIADNVVPY